MALTSFFYQEDGKRISPMRCLIFALFCLVVWLVCGLINDAIDNSNKVKANTQEAVENWTAYRKRLMEQCKADGHPEYHCFSLIYRR